MPKPHGNNSRKRHPPSPRVISWRNNKAVGHRRHSVSLTGGTGIFVNCYNCCKVRLSVCFFANSLPIPEFSIQEDCWGMLFVLLSLQCYVRMVSVSYLISSPCRRPSTASNIFSLDFLANFFILQSGWWHKKPG